MSDLLVTPLGSGRYLLASGTRRQTAYAVSDGASVWVFLNGRTYRVGDTESRLASRDEGLALSAPMPATVVLLNVGPGERVAAGDVLVILEAMKMELPIRAPRAGRVSALRCRPGEIVQPGVPLVDLD